jgi:hypothetical protein
MRWRWTASKKPEEWIFYQLNLLPMASGESKSNHVLLAVAASRAKVLEPLAKGFEESGVVYHAGTFTFD